jgi:peptidoglycan/xylan/chitin deacetylase (PgdA/CDA1 family)
MRHVQKMTPGNLITMFCFALCCYQHTAVAQSADKKIQWPDGKQVAVSLSFDDARQSQVDVGAGLFDKYGVKATFYVVPGTMESRIDGWKEAVKNGHEIGNHSLNHPCTGNFAWSRDNALENYTIEDMRKELEKANAKIDEMLGVVPVSFAYPCGQKFVGRGADTKSYVPLISELFDTGRGWLDEAANAPDFADPAQLTGVEMDGKDFKEIKLLIDKAKENGDWLILAGHEIGTKGSQTTRISMLKKLIKYAQDSANKIWRAPVGTIAGFIDK